MTRGFSKNNKRGLTLPVAIVISIVLVIVAAGLVFIALSSISTTSVTVNGRQAFMDVRSALEYVESYYRNQKKPDYAMMGNGTGIEYFAVEETTKSATDTAKTVKYVKSNSQPDLNIVKTYVEAVYISSAESGDNTAKLKLTGYSYYADEFGHMGSSVNMSVTFTIGASGSQRRVTVIDRKERIQYNNATDTIKLNLRMPADLDWKLCYYVWTYYDVTGNINGKDRTGAGAYADYGKNSYFTDRGERIKPDVNKLNASERSNNEYTNMAWDEDKGTSGRMVPQANNWFSGDYKIFSNRVNYFNVIFTSEGKVLKNNGDYDSQLNEIFHLWYLFPDDKNVFFEFLNKPKSGGPDDTYYTRYYRGSGWDGKQGLDDTIIVYLRNQKTTLHFRALNDNKGAYQNEITALSTNPPTISYIANSSDSNYATLPSFLKSGGPETECNSHKDTFGIKMTYEGCGWWVANIETKKTFNIRITYKGVEYGLNGIRPIANMVAPDSVPETWLVLRERTTNASASEKYLEAHVSEKTALSALGELTTSYVTVHAKNYDPDQKDDTKPPLLSYDIKGIDSTDGRNRLYSKLVEVQMLDESDYENYRSLFLDSGLLEKARKAYNTSDFVDNILRFDGTIEKNPETTLTKKIEEADKEYDKYVSALNENLGKLVQAAADNATLTSFNQLYSQATEYTKNYSLYDNGAYVSFESVYNSAEVKNAKNGALTKVETLNQLRRLRASVAALEESKLDRTVLSSLVTASAKYLQNDTQYGSAQITTLENLLQVDGVIKDDNNNDIPKANDLIKDETVTMQADIDKMAAAVNSALSAVRASYSVSGVDTTRLSNLLELAQNKLTTSGSNFTDESKGQLQTAVTDAETTKTTAEVTQDAINAAADKLQLAVYRFDVIKPGVKEDVSTSVADGKTRVWFNIGSDNSVKVKKLNDAGEVIEDVTRYVDTTGNTSGTALGLSCITLTDSTTKKIKLVVTDSSGAEFKSEAFDIATLKTTDYLQIDYTAKTVTAKQSTVLFIARKVDNRNIGSKNITVKAGAAVLNKATSTNYYIFRFPSDAGSVSVSALDKDYGSVGTLGAGEYVIWLNGDQAKVVGLNDIYPKPVQPIPDEEPKTDDIVARSDDYEIRQVATEFEDVFNHFRSSMEDDDMFIFFNKSDFSYRGYPQSGSEDYNVARVYMYGNSAAGKIEENAYPGKEIKEYGNYYYYKTKKNWNYLILSYGSARTVDGQYYDNEALKLIKDYKLPRDGRGYHYDCYLIGKENGNYKVTQSKHTDYDKTFTSEEIKNRISKMVQDETIVILKTFDSDHYKSEVPKIKVWNDSGDYTGGYKEMYNFQELSSFYCYEFPKTYDQIQIEQLGDASKAKLPRKADGTLYDWYIIYEANNVIQFDGQGNAESYYVREEYKPYDPNEEQTQTTFGEEVKLTTPLEDSQSFVLLNTAGEIADSPYMLNQYYSEGAWQNETWQRMGEYMSGDPKYRGYHCRVFDSKNTRLSIAKDSAGTTDILMKDVDLPLNPYTNEVYKYYIITYDKNGKVWFSYYGNDVPNWEFDGRDYTVTTGHKVDFKYDNIPMAYVGGGKIRVKNYSYDNIYSGKKTNAAGANISVNSPFGGSGINDHSGNRLGNSILVPYYDWYEYKIPVDQIEKYNFAIKGLDLDHYDVQTREVEDAMGDVWISLFNDDIVTETIDDTSTQVFDKAELSTFDTDIYQASSNVTLYFKLPSDKDATGALIYGSGNAKVTEAHGIKYGTSPAKDTGSKNFVGLERYGNTHIFKVENISKYTPFITVTYGSGVTGTAAKVYNIKLQGGKKVLFNPNANGGLGGWEDFTSDNEDLKEVCQNLLDMYASKTIISGYTSSGDVKSDAKYHASEYLGGKYDEDQKKYIGGLFNRDIYKDYFIMPAGSSTYQLQLSNIMTLQEKKEDDKPYAYGVATSLRAEYDKLNTLYTLMAQARSYIAQPLTNSDGSTYHAEMESDSRYPEYVSAGNNSIYESDGMNTLRSKLKDAEAAYLDAPSLSVIEDAINGLNRAIVNLKVNTAGSIAVVLYDVQNRVDAGHRLQLVYYTNETSRDDTYKVVKNISLDDDINSEGYPIVFIDNPVGNKIYEVQFYDRTEELPVGVSRNVMEANEAWVYMDFKENGEWRENSTTDFRDILADEYKQSGTDGVKFVMKKVTKNSKTVYEDMTLYFKYDTKIIFADSSQYTIKSGAYTFQASSKGTPKAPLQKEGDNVVLDLFTAEAKTYFETPENYKKYTKDALDGKSALWWNNNTFSKSHRSVLGANVNLDVTKDTKLGPTECSFAELLFTQYYSFSTDKGIYFRWSSPEPLYVGGAGVRMYASEYRLGSVGEINGTDYGSNGTHFYLYAYDSSADQVQISVINDIKISYFDEMNKAHSFVIREGDYIIKKEYKQTVYGGVKQKTEYIADLFNETYWKSLEYVVPLEGGSDIKNWGKGNIGLSNPVYGN